RPGTDLPAPARALRAQRAPHRRGAVQGGGPGAARRVRARPAGDRRPVHERHPVTNSYSAALLILLGLFLLGGVISFAKQKMSKGIITLLGLCSVMALAAGAMR